MSHKIVKNKDYLRVKTTPVATLEEGQEIAIKLISALASIGTGIGLSANQIGIQKSVSIVFAKKDKEPIVLINPVITELSKEKLVYLEGCLSLPGKMTRTIRNTKVTVTSLGHDAPLVFGPDIDPVTPESIGSDRGVLECACVQHEIDHLNGLLMVDSRFTPPTPNVARRYGRNEKVLVEKDGETSFVKYKKANELLSNGWRII